MIEQEEFEENIGTFIGHFERDLEMIKSMQSFLVQKMLYVALLDTLSKIIAPNKSNHDRFIKIIDSYSKWVDSSRVSAQQLFLNLDLVLDKGKKESSELYKCAGSVLAKLDDGHIYRSVIDPYYGTLINICLPEESKALKFARYDELLYIYRNRMIHELRPLGGMEFSNDGETPYYHSEENRAWQLVFPVSMFRSMAERAIKNIRIYLEHNKANPYDFYEFGDRWTPKNKLE